MSTFAETNPLLEIRFPIPFDRIETRHIEPAIDNLLSQARAEMERLGADTGARTFANTMLALDELTTRLEYAVGIVKHLESVVTNPQLREVYNAVQPEVSAFYSSIPLDPGLWRVIRAYAQTGEAANLVGARRRFLAKTLDNFRRHGAELDAAGKARLAEIDVELTRLTTRFAQNVVDSTGAFELILTEEARLSGLPPNAVDAARENAAAKGVEGWRFSLQAPSYIAVMTYLDDASIRERLYRAYTMRAAAGEKDNRPVLREILRLRREKACLLGYRDFADFVLEDRMARDGARAREFLETLHVKTADRFRQENEELLAFRRSVEGESASPLEPWDVAYYAEKLRAASYDFNEEDLRPHFPLEKVVAGMFAIVERLFGIQVQPGNAPAWHPEVRYYEIRDGDGSLLGAFYTDWYPRENKRDGAWMDSFITGVPVAGGFQPHLGLMCGNLTPPLSGKPALLTHREVETIFHEFGHLLHHCLSRVELRSLAGANVAWDFVELPSQIMENWCWEREALDLFARHYETGAAIPEDLYQKMKRARTFRSANTQMRQLGFGFLDLALHREFPVDSDADPIAYTREILQRFSPARLPAEHAMIAAFTHLFANPVGYGAGYYSYKWAEVLEADAFTRFRDDGVFNSEIGLAFRDRILSRGDSEDPGELYRSFMGRDPDVNALLERLGLLESLA